MSRRVSREIAMKLIYGQLLGGSDLRSAYDDIAQENKLSIKDDEFVWSIVNGVIEHQDEMTDIIKGYSRRWTTDRLPKIDLALLLIGVFECGYTDNPNGAVINECVELAKNYSTTKSGAYVNGVLSSYNKSLIADK